MPQQLNSSRYQRISLIAGGVLFSFLCSGVVFGFQPLLQVLESTGVFHDHCPPPTPAPLSTTSENVCEEQKRLLRQLFTVASSLTNASAIIIGYILDTYGPQLTITIGSLLFLLGNAGFSLASTSASLSRLYLPAYGLLGIGGPFIFMSTLHLSEAFPAHSGLVISLLTGAFDSSSIIYQLFSMIYTSTGGEVGIKEFFGGYCLVPILCFVYGLTMMPRRPFSAANTDCPEVGGDSERNSSSPSSSPPSSFQSDNASLNGRDTVVKFNADVAADRVFDEKSPLLLTHNRRNSYPLKDRPVLEQISTGSYWLMVVFMCLHMIRLNFYMESMKYQVGSLFGDSYKHQQDEIISWFGFLLPLGGLAAIPPMSWLLDNYSPTVSFNLISLFTLIFGVASVVPSIWLQYVAILVFVVMRPLLYTVASDYCAKAYGFRTFGQVYGLMVLVSALFGSMLYLLEFLVRQVFAGDYLLVNIGLTVLCATIGWLFPASLIFGGKREN